MFQWYSRQQPLFSGPLQKHANRFYQPPTWLHQLPYQKYGYGPYLFSKRNNSLIKHVENLQTVQRHRRILLTLSAVFLGVLLVSVFLIVSFFSKCNKKL